jgi:hypothetical protein
MTTSEKCRRQVVIITGSFLILSTIFLSLASCMRLITEEELKSRNNPLNYIEIVEVEGMTCAIYKLSNSGGISCNWAEWEGKSK